MRILLVEDEPEILEMMVFLLESRFGSTAVEASSGNMAVEILKKDLSFDCVVSDYNMNDGNGAVVFHYLRKNAPKIPFILCSAGSRSGPMDLDLTQVDGFIEKPFIMEPLAALLKMLISSGRIKIPQGPVTYSAYCRIPIPLVRRIAFSPCDLYVKLADDKFVRLFPGNEALSGKDLSRYEQKTIEYLYLRRQDLSLFLKSMEHDLLGMLRQDDLGFDSGTAISMESLQLISELTRQIGMTPEIRGLTKASVRYTLQLLRSTPGTQEIIQRIMDSGHSFLLSHSLVIAFVACSIAERLGIADQDTCRSLVLAAFLHDVTLTNPAMIPFQSLDQLESSTDVARFSYTDMENFHHHPEGAAKITEVVEDFPRTASQIVAEHHEAADGSGFPAGKVGSQLSLLSSLFIVTEDLILTLDKSRPMISVKSFAEARKAKYGNGNFGMVLTALARDPS